MASKSTYVAVGAVALLIGAGGFISGTLADGAARPGLNGNPAVPLVAHLRGAEETPSGGDVDGGGIALINVNRSIGEVCIDLTTENITTWTAAHIHPGEVGVSNPPVVDFNITAAQPGPRLSKCVSGVPASLIDDIAATPSDFYVNVHSNEYPQGAVRGQLVARSSETQLLNPTRVYDSRQGEGKLAVGTTRTIDLKVPLGVRAALITLTVDGTEGGGYVTAYANDTTLPATSTINWTASNQAVATTTTVAVDRDGKIKLTAGQNSTHVIVDVLGFIV